MRMIFGVLSLLLALAVVGFLVKKQMPSVNTVKLPDGGTPAGGTVAGDGANAGPASPSLSPNTAQTPSVITSTNVQQQSELIQQQVQQQLRAATEAALQQTRPILDQK